MTTALVILAALAALACPLHAFGRSRRGRTSCGLAPRADAATLRDRQSVLSERIRALTGDGALDRRD